MGKYKYTKEYINDLEILKDRVELTAKGLVKLDELKELIQIAEKYNTLQASTDKSKLLLDDVSNRRELLIAFQSWQFDKGYLYQKNLQNGMIEEFLKSNL